MVKGAAQNIAGSKQIPSMQQSFLDLASTVSCCGSPARDCTGRKELKVVS